MYEISELQMQRESIVESLCESIFDGSTEAVEFFRFMLADIDRGLEVVQRHLRSN